MAVLLGTWLSHTVEYYRVWGSAEFANSTARTAHDYFGPLGVVLALAGAGLMFGSMTLARRLKKRIDRLRAMPLGVTHLVLEPLPPGRWTPSFPTLWADLWFGQLALYIIQENFEARATGTTPPGLGAITGIHAWAPVVHLAIAGLGAGVVWLTRRRLAALATELRQVLQSLACRLRRAERLARRWSCVRAWTPGQRWGLALWARPPPPLSA